MDNLPCSRYLQIDGKYYSDDTPYSCCDPRSPRPCIHHHIHDNKRHQGYNVNVETTLYVTGCRTALMTIYGRVLLTVALIATIIACMKVSRKLNFVFVYMFLRLVPTRTLVDLLQDVTAISHNHISVHRKQSCRLS